MLAGAFVGCSPQCQQAVWWRADTAVKLLLGAEACCACFAGPCLDLLTNPRATACLCDCLGVGAQQGDDRWRGVHRHRDGGVSSQAGRVVQAGHHWQDCSGGRPALGVKVVAFVCQHA